MYGTLNPRKEATVAIADSRGYLLKKRSKFSDSFNHNKHVYDTSAASWPKVCLSLTTLYVYLKGFLADVLCMQPNTLINPGAHATMGYKGILTDYLNASTVSIPSVDIAGCKERNYH